MTKRRLIARLWLAVPMLVLLIMLGTIAIQRPVYIAVVIIGAASIVMTAWAISEEGKVR